MVDTKITEPVVMGVIEQIAQQWDGCTYEAPGETLDIGDAIRRAGKRLSAELAFDVEAMLTACVPGGNIVDPQVVADNIRAWVAKRKPAELAEQQGDALVTDEMVEAAKRAMYFHCQPDATEGEYLDDKEEGDALAPAFRAALHAALAATGKQQVGVPDGWKLVPIEPTWDMRNEGREFLIEGMEHQPERAAYFLWKTMVAAAPEVE